MIKTDAGNNLLAINAYVGAYLEGPIDPNPNHPTIRGNLKQQIEAIEAEAIEIGKTMKCRHQEYHIEESDVAAP